MEQNLSIRYYRAVYVNNEPVSVVESAGDTKELVEVHPNGLLIYAVVRAGSLEEARYRAILQGGHHKAERQMFP